MRLPIADPVDLLAWLAASGADDGASTTAWSRLSEEVADSTLNDALCRERRAALEHGVAEAARTAGLASMWEWLRTRPHDFDVSLWLEQWSATGHPLHLAPKTRTGVTPSESLAHFPDFQPRFPVRLGAVPRVAASCELHPSLDDLAVWFEGELPAWMASWSAWLRSLGRDPADYLPLPVHPLFAGTTRPASDTAVLPEGVLLDGPAAPCAPTLSVRTVVPAAAGRPPHLKLTLDVRLTSVQRTISARSCAMGPRISALLDKILACDTVLAASVTTAPELAGVHVAAASSKAPAAGLAAIFRRSPAHGLPSGSTAIPASALSLVSPVSNVPFLLEVLAPGRAEPPGDPRPVFRTYLQTLLRPVLRFYLCYGIALEAHPQNSFLVVDAGGRPERMLLRDFAGIRIHEPTLRAAGHTLQVHPDRLTVTDDWEKARRKLTHAVLQWHVGHLAWSLSRPQGIDERALWCVAREVTAAIFDEQRGDAPSSRWAAERAYLLDAEWTAKSSLRMRLAGTQSEIFVEAGNPFRVGVPDSTETKIEFSRPSSESGL
jgi:siderophore synthetase component